MKPSNDAKKATRNVLKRLSGMMVDMYVAAKL